MSVQKQMIKKRTLVEKSAGEAPTSGTGTCRIEGRGAQLSIFSAL